WTLASANVIPASDSGTVAGEGVNDVAPETLGISPGWGQPGVATPPNWGKSPKSAVTGDGFADDQILHLICTLIGVQRLGIGEETCDIVVGHDAVAAQDLAAP